MNIKSGILAITAAAGIFASCKSNSTATNDSHELIKFSQDTLDFGSLTVGTTKTMSLDISNIGSITAVIKTVAPNTANSPYAISGVPLTVAQSAKGTITISLTPTSAGAYFEQFNVTTDDGSLFHFYAKDIGSGGGGGGIDSIEYSFVVVGCNRISKGDFNPSTDPSSANLAQINRTLSEIAALDPKPNFFFAAGDIVLGESDSITLAKQLIAWKALYESSPAKAAGIRPGFPLWLPILLAEATDLFRIPAIRIIFKAINPNSLTHLISGMHTSS